MILVVTAYRWGDQESHSYVVGAYLNYGSAAYAADVEKTWRGGKYECKITEHTIGEIEEKKDEYHKSCI